MSYYDPNAHRVVLGADATLWEEFHEHAHARQQRQQTLAWRAMNCARRIPVLCRFTMLAVEIEASIWATRELQWCGIWEPQDGRQAIRGLATYVRALFIGAK